MDPFELRRINAVKDRVIRCWWFIRIPEEDLIYGSYGLDQCLDLAESALRQRQRRAGTGWARSGASARGWRWR